MQCGKTNLLLECCKGQGFSHTPLMQQKSGFYGLCARAVISYLKVSLVLVCSGHL
jgi:hypothetical protein